MISAILLSCAYHEYQQYIPHTIMLSYLLFFHSRQWLAVVITAYRLIRTDITHWFPETHLLSPDVTMTGLSGRGYQLSWLAIFAGPIPGWLLPNLPLRLGCPNATVLCHYPDTRQKYLHIHDFELFRWLHLWGHDGGSGEPQSTFPVYCLSL